MTLDPIGPLWLVASVCVLAVVVAVVKLVSSPTRLRLRWALRIGMIVLVSVLALRPVIPPADAGPVASGGLEVYIVVDTTSSMAAEDYPRPGSAGAEALAPDADAPDVTAPDVSAAPGARLDGVRDDIGAITSALVGAQFSLTTFDSATVQRVPLTSDATALVSAASALSPEVTFFSQGSSIDEPLTFMSELLAEAQEEHPERSRVLFYLGDGEQTRDTAPSPFTPLAPYLGGGGVLGYGTAEGGVMRVFDGYGADDDEAAPSYIVDPVTGQDAVSSADEASLRAIAGQLGVGFVQREPGDAVDEIVAGIEVGDVSISQEPERGPVEFAWLAAIPLGLLALVEIIRLAGTLAATRRPGAQRGQGATS
ncbi:MAG: hypothetical protein RI885_2578 [Actinomycetota bacterium]